MASVLVADDDPGIRRVLEFALEEYTLVFAKNGRETLDLLRQMAFDAAVLDVMMPEMDGVEALQHIREDPSLADLPVVMLTAKVGEDDHFRAFEHGADAYVTKPFDPEALIATIDKIIATPPQQRARQRQQEKDKADLLRELEKRFQ